VFPTVTDQLREVCRILDDVVRPAVSGSYAEDTLSSVLATLKMLEGAWDRVVPFLLWDNEQLSALLGDGAERPDPSDFTAVHERNLELRDRLARLVGDGAQPAELVAYFRERIARYPFTSTVALPSRK